MSTFPHNLILDTSRAMEHGAILPGCPKRFLSRPDRMQTLSDAKNDKSKDREVFRLDFGGNLHELDVIEVPISLPKYRLQNGRTLSLQEEFLASNETVPDMFFSNDPESEEAQIAQHSLLLTVIKETELFKHFVNPTNRQTEPLILDNEGVVINGNRRLATWRAIRELGGESFSHFDRVLVVRLPVADEEALKNLEFRLQIKPQLQADYAWHARARMYKEVIGENEAKIKDISNFYGISKPEIRDLIEARQYAEDYLISRGNRGKWSLLDKDQYAFRNLARERRRISVDGQKDILKEAVFALVDSEKGGDRVYGQVKDIARHIDTVGKRLIEDFEDEIQSEDVLDSEDGIDEIADLFGEDVTSAGEQEKASKLNAVAAHLSMEADPSRVRETVVNAIASAKANEAEIKSAQFLFKQVQKARDSLEAARTSGLTPSAETKGVERQLQEIEKLVGAIRKFLSD